MNPRVLVLYVVATSVIMSCMDSGNGVQASPAQARGDSVHVIREKRQAEGPLDGDLPGFGFFDQNGDGGSKGDDSDFLLGHFRWLTRFSWFRNNEIYIT